MASGLNFIQQDLFIAPVMAELLHLIRLWQKEPYLSSEPSQGLTPFGIGIQITGVSIYSGQC
jgi:hypothetical protein